MEKELDNLAFQFLKKFARFEYSLKAGNMFLENKTEATPDWRQFALSIEDSLSERSLDSEDKKDLKEAVNYLLSDPPRKQIINGGELDWESVMPTTDSRADKILILVRRVRNNLFHGGKFSRIWIDAERSKKPMETSLLILDECLNASPRISEIYNV